MPDHREGAKSFLPLTGVTVLAWEQAVSLPMATRLLADFGATVIRLEAPPRGGRRPRHLSNDLARNKLSLAVDLKSEQGRGLVHGLVREVDVLCENFTPRVKRAFGLTYEALRAEREDLIMLSLTGYGQTGAWAERPTYGPGIESAAGHARTGGYADAPPTRPGTIVYADNISGFYAALAILGALHRRKATGKGQFIDLAMYEANAFHLGLSITKSSLSGEPEARRGNGDPAAVIQDVFESRELERWLAVAVRPGQEQALAELLGAPLDAGGRAGHASPLQAPRIPPRFNSIPSPRRGGTARPPEAGRQGEASPSLRDWVRTQDAAEAAVALQEIGIAAAPLLDARDVLLNEQLRGREAFSLIEHEQPVNGYAAHPHAASPWLFAGHPRPHLHEAPAVGQDSRTVLRRWAGLSGAAIDQLVRDGVVGEGPSPGPFPTREGETTRVKPMAVFEDTQYYRNQRFSGAAERRETFSAVEFEDCVFDRCVFAECVFSRCRFVQCSFKECDLGMAQFPNSRFTDVQFSGCKLTGVDWTKCGDSDAARLPLSVGFDGCILDYANFSGLSLRNIALPRCSAKEADFSEADMRGAGCNGSDFSAAKFFHTNLEKANFVDARNYGFDLTANKVRGAKFSLPEALSLLQPFGVVITG